MDRFEVSILGCGSASPSLRHHPSSQIVNHRERLMMIDCGEGSQLQMLRMGLPMSRITDIFISHMHGDHCLGVPGLLSTLALNDRGPEASVNVYVPPMGVDIMRRMIDFFCGGAAYPINIIPLETGVVMETKSLTVSAFPLFHRIPTFGFRMEEKPKERKLRGDMADFLQIPLRMRPSIKAGADFVKEDGTIVPNDRLTTDAPPALSYAYCSDTTFSRRVIEAVEGVDLLYHESTYPAELQAKAAERGHSTTVQAATVAREAGVGRLIIGHYSKRYTDTAPLLAEAQAIFPRTIAANEGLTVRVEHINDASSEKTLS